MKICRFDDFRLGLVEGDQVLDVTSILDLLPVYRYPLPQFDPFIANLDYLLPAIKTAALTARRLPLADVVLLSPVANPGKLVAAPVNYTKHLEEVLANDQLHHQVVINDIYKAGLFLKATSSLVGVGAGVTLNHPERRNDHEIELAVVIGRTAKDVKRENALSYVAGYAIGLDMTIRGPEERSLRKSPDSYSVLGPWLVTADEIPDPTGLEFVIKVNGEVRQHANTRDLIMGVEQLIEFASSFYTLHPGDVIFTGTPEGVAPVLAGDVMDAQIQGIGQMRVSVL
ncbi:MAG: FAA hydrolase family protein [Rhodocyclaceae bacterium]|nr:MAG: FAA hydrolase family protein [Rhodocyclaceae bacterium]